MGILKDIKKVLGIVQADATWAENEVTKGLDDVLKVVTKVYSSQIAQLVLNAAIAVDPATGKVLSDAEKLFQVATGIVAILKNINLTLPFSAAVTIAQNAYAQVELVGSTFVHDCEALVAGLKSQTSAA